jgi:flagellar basal-body rod protein FlgF
MDRLAFTAMASINERRLLREQLNNELANVSTVGFKKSFESAMIAVKAKGDGFDTRIQPFIDKMNAVNLEPGSIMATGNKLDVALLDKAVLGVQAKDGTLAFTRRGDLHLNSQGVLENGSYNPVLSQDGVPITIPQGFDVQITREGDIYARDPAQPAPAVQILVGRLMLRDASNIVFQRRPDSLYTPQQEFRRGNGDFQNGPNQPIIAVGALESSNVNPVTAMVKLIDFSRSFETQVRTIKEAKSLDESGASMLRTRN